MPRSTLNALLTRKTLDRMATMTNQDFQDALLEGRVESVSGEMPLKNVCAKLSVALSDEVDEMCGFLDISKRRFIEAAIIDALQQAETIMQEEGVWDLMEASVPTPGEVSDADA
jgi:hypothetical protein